MPMAIPGIVLISIIMAIYESASLYPDKGVSGHATAIVVCAFVLPLFVQIGYVFFVCRNLKFDPVYKEHLGEHRKTTLTLIGLSIALNFRLVKLIYTNFSSRFNLHSLRDEQPASSENQNSQNGVWSIKRFNMLLSTLMVPSDIALCFVAISAFQSPESDSLLQKVTIERVFVSFVLASFTLSEFVLPQKTSQQSNE